MNLLSFYLHRPDLCEMLKIKHVGKPCGEPALFQLWELSFLTALLTAQFSSVAQSCPTLRPHESQHARPPCPSPTPGVHSNSCPLSQ